MFNGALTRINHTADHSGHRTLNNASQHNGTSEAKSFDPQGSEIHKNSHAKHRTEEIHSPESRPFLKDPGWPRNDIHPNLLNY